MNIHYKGGIILVDVIMAFSLSLIFVVLLTQSTIASREMFDRALEREYLINQYEQNSNYFDNMDMYQSRSLQNATGSTKWFGNDRIQTTIFLNSTSSYQGSKFNQTISFVQIKAYPTSDTIRYTSAPLCTTNFTNKSVVGSYQFLLDSGNQGIPAPTIIPIPLPITASLPMTDVEVRNDTAYVSIDSNTASDPDILILDIKDPAHATIKSALNTGPGISAFSLAGEYIFAAAASTLAQLHIIHIDSSGLLNLDIKYQLPLPYATATPPYATSISQDNNLIYVGTEKWDGDEFSIIDVSDPALPFKIGGLETGTIINDIFVRDGLAYLATADEKQLRIIDVSNPTHPLILDSFSPPGWQRQEGKTISFFENALNFGRTSGGFNIATDHELFSWPESQTARLIQPMQIPKSIDVPSGIYGIVNDRSYTFVANRQPGKEFQILDHSLSTSTVLKYSLPSTPHTITCDNSSLYFLSHNASIIYKVLF